MSVQRSPWRESSQLVAGSRRLGCSRRLASCGLTVLVHPVPRCFDPQGVGQRKSVEDRRHRPQKGRGEIVFLFSRESGDESNLHSRWEKRPVLLQATFPRRSNRPTRALTLLDMACSERRAWSRPAQISTGAANSLPARAFWTQAGPTGNAQSCDAARLNRAITLLLLDFGHTAQL